MIKRVKALADRWLSRNDTIILTLLLLSLTLNVHFGWKLKHLGVNEPTDITVGTRIPTLWATDIRGSTVKLDWGTGSRSTLFYLFSPDCHWCARNLENIKSLSAFLATKYRVIWISPDASGVAKYVADYHVSVPVYMNPVLKSGSKFSLSGTPKTLIISPDGMVAEVWRGAYTDLIQVEIEKKMRIRLPGLLADLTNLQPVPH
jgi:hypothetical protein